MKEQTIIHKASNIQWAGSSYHSFVILDRDSNISLVPSLFIAHLSINGKSQNTVKSYAEKLNQYFRVLESSNDLSWESADEELLSIYINQYLSKKLSLVSSSIKVHLAAISAFYEWAWNFGFLDEKPALGLGFGAEEVIESSSGVGSKNHIKQYISDHFCPVNEKEKA